MVFIKKVQKNYSDSSNGSKSNRGKPEVYTVPKVPKDGVQSVCEADTLMIKNKRKCKQGNKSI